MSFSKIGVINLHNLNVSYNQQELNVHKNQRVPESDCTAQSGQFELFLAVQIMYNSKKTPQEICLRRYEKGLICAKISQTKANTL